VGLRVPAHPVALELLKQFESIGGYGIAAPSANRFGAVSPTTAIAVENEIGKYLSDLDLILDGGPAQVGVESTIVSCINELPIILRPGAITKEMIEQLLGVELAGEVVGLTTNKIRASGLLESHYAPKAKVFLSATPTAGDGFIAPSSFATPTGVIRLAAPNTNEEYAHTLYEALRLADAKGLTRVFAITPTGGGIAEAVCDRLQRAASKS
jgi:L-threonylcarbamoyladenylate synthase